MPAPSKYPDELRERAIRLTVQARKDPADRSGACKRIGEQLGINPETLRGWVSQAEVDEGTRPGVMTSDTARLLQLEKENRELRRANEILRTRRRFSQRRSSTANGCSRQLHRREPRGARGRADLRGPQRCWDPGRS